MNRVLIIILLFGFITNSNADVGSCGIYKCSLLIKNADKPLVGYIQIASYDLPKTDMDLMTRLKKSHKNGFSFYSKIQVIKNPQIDCLQYATAAAIEDTRFVAIKEVSSIKMLDVMACEAFVDDQNMPIHSKTEFGIHCYHPILDELYLREIGLLKESKPYDQTKLPGFDIDGLHILNYNSKIDNKEFQQLAGQLVYKKLPEESWKSYWEKWNENYRRVKEELREQKIIVIKIISYT